MLQASAQAVDFKVGHHFGEGQPSTLQASLLDAPVLRKQQGFRQLSWRLRASALLNENSSA
jgi:hypothetical protein